jgi:hypothetical protein
MDKRYDGLADFHKMLCRKICYNLSTFSKFHQYHTQLTGTFHEDVQAFYARILSKIIYTYFIGLKAVSNKCFEEKRSSQGVFSIIRCVLRLEPSLLQSDIEQKAVWEDSLSICLHWHTSDVRSSAIAYWSQAVDYIWQLEKLSRAVILSVECLECVKGTRLHWWSESFFFLLSVDI